ncbi:cytochrome c oxidase polypeptide 5 [Viridothelium virens]|uniref:Cytochrome c oxidase polypeptide V n=1 Tax=Viridothelium virens TaxID=1048519 RepID=A0A6A6HKR6_VIRVR|nr:cytochrome c oxidase polypeptide 5 [Viridothelium virens]
MLRSSTLRASNTVSTAFSSSSLCRASRIAQVSRPLACFPQQPSRQAHAISNPTLANIEKRWEEMPPQEQADLWMQLRDRMKVDWHEMTLQEKKAAYWIAFGPHGPRAGTPPGENWKVFSYTLVLLAVATGVFALTRHFARPPPKTMTKEYQEQTNEYLKSQNTEPITGVSSEGYKGKGMVQSK